MQWTRHPLGVYTLDLSNGPLREEIIFQLERAVAFTMATGADRELFALNALELVLLLCQRAGPSNKIIESDQPTRLCLEYIAANLKNKIKLSELAKVSGQSVSRLTQKFRQKTGLSPMQFLEQQRVERAMDLMARTDLKIQSIGEEVGFECPFYFSLRFRKHTGFNPRAFRIHAKAAKTILRRPNLHLNPADLQMLRQSGGS
jgi:AraC family transcriptional regulator of arabinose operon